MAVAVAFASHANADTDDARLDSVEHCQTNQSTMNECAEHRLDQAEQAMNVEIQKLRGLLADSERLEFFEKEVEAWHAYRDAHCLANNLYASGSFGIAYGNRCREELTKDRTRKLEDFAAQLSNADKQPYAAIEY
ncbi:MAG TPA: lysozyme inhibitor LprI family protein [Rhodanobacteraceae bacterium]